MSLTARQAAVLQCIRDFSKRGYSPSSQKSPALLDCAAILPWNFTLRLWKGLAICASGPKASTEVLRSWNR